MTEIDVITDVKTLLGIVDADYDDLLSLIIKNTQSSLKLRIGLKTADSVPDDLAHVVIEVAIRRYNRRKNEGMASYSQEGETITYATADFDDFADDIEAWKEANAKPTSYGAVRFVNAYGGGK